MGLTQDELAEAAELPNKQHYITKQPNSIIENGV